MLNNTDSESKKENSEVGRFDLKSGFILWERNKICYYSAAVYFVLLFFAVFTGLLLFLFYKDGTGYAHESVEYIVYNVKFGWLIHAVHKWAAHFAVISAFVHIMIMLFYNRYIDNRRFIFITFILLLFVLIFFVYTGSILPWNNEALLIFKESTDVLSNLPVMGDILIRVLISSPDTMNLDLNYIYKAHIFILPVIFFLILAIHIVLLINHEYSKINKNNFAGENNGSKIHVYPDLVLRLFIVFLVLSNILFALSVVFPNPVNMKADYLFQSATGLLPAWYFIFIYQFGRFFEYINLPGKNISYSIIVFIPVILLFILPFLRYNKYKSIPGKLVKYSVIILLIFILFLTVFGYFTGDYY